MLWQGWYRRNRPSALYEISFFEPQLAVGGEVATFIYPIDFADAASLQLLVQSLIQYSTKIQRTACLHFLLFPSSPPCRKTSPGLLTDPGYRLGRRGSHKREPYRGHESRKDRWSPFEKKLFGVLCENWRRFQRKLFPLFVNSNNFALTSLSACQFHQFLTFMEQQQGPICIGAPSNADVPAGNKLVLEIGLLHRREVSSIHYSLLYPFSRTLSLPPLRSNSYYSYEYFS